MPRIDSAKTIQQKQILWDEIEAINQQGLERLLDRSGLLNHLDPDNEAHLKIAAQLLNISEEEAKRRFTLSPEVKERLVNFSFTEEALQNMRRKLQAKAEEQERIAEVISEIREQGSTIREMSIGLTTTRELLKAVKKYGSIEEAILAFREAALSKGYKGLEPEMVPVIEVYGNLRDLALLVFVGFIQGTGYNSPLITQKEAQKIRDKITSTEQGFSLYRTLIMAYPTLNISQWISNYYKQSYSHYIALTAEAITKWKNEKKLQAIYGVVSEMVSGAQLERVTELTGEPSLQRLQKLWMDVVECSKRANEALSDFKGAIVMCEEWLRDKDAMELFSYPYGLQRKPLLNTEAYSDIPYNYYVRSLTSSEVPEGATDPDGEEGTALLMNYEDIEPSEIGRATMEFALNSEFNERDKYRPK